MDLGAGIQPVVGSDEGDKGLYAWKWILHLRLAFTHMP